MDKILIQELGVAVVARDEGKLSDVATKLASKYSVSEIRRIWKSVESELSSKDIVWVTSKLQGSGELLELSAPLTLEEQVKKRDIETNWNAFLKSFVDRGNDLIYLRDNKLYRDEYPNWKTYCQFKLGIGERQAYRLIEAANVVNQLQTIEEPPALLPASESIARELAKCKPNARPLVWDIVVEKSNEESEPITAEFVSNVVKEVKSKNIQDDTPPLEFNIGEIVKFKRGKSLSWGEVQSEYTEGNYVVFDGTKETVVKAKHIYKMNISCATYARVNQLHLSDNKLVKSIAATLHSVFDFNLWHLELLELLEKQCVN